MEMKKYGWLLSRSGIPDDIKIVPFGPYLSPGMEEAGAAEMLREKLPVRAFVVLAM